MDSIVENVIAGLSSYALEQFKLLYNLEDDFQKMKDTVLAIKAVLLDAEAKATNSQISDWLTKLKDVLYDADDLLDDFSFEALRREVMSSNYTFQIEGHVGPLAGTRNNGAACFCSIYVLFLLMAKEVRIFFSPSNQIFFGLEMGSKMKKIRKRLDGISDDKNKFQLVPNYFPMIPCEYKEWRETYSFVREPDVIGWEEEKTDIIKCLLDSKSKDVVSVIPIVGIGGVGKTALAQLVYNAQVVSKHFELNMWVCVSDDFNIKRIAQKMLGPQTNDGEIEHVQQALRQKIKDKRFLLVLDDVWNENSELWHKLESLLKEGANGSIIIVTTRSAKVANIMASTPPVFELSGLDEERSWRLFCRMAFKSGEDSKKLELEKIGKDIVKKCAGVPLAIRTIGSLLSQNLSKSAWLNFRNIELSKIEEGEKQIFSILKLSYDHLPSQLKSCFAYCSLFPKDFNFERKTLIQLWMAQGFIPKSNTMRSEDVGHDYFMNLLSRSFFQDVEMDGYGEIWKCKMHDLMHDLALLVAVDEQIVVIEGKEVNINDRARHLSFSFDIDDCGKIPTSLFKANKLRTFVLPCQNFDSDVSIKKSFFHSLASVIKCSRVLDFNGLGVKEIPKSVEKLNHLRYLDLSYSKIKMLPQGITNLVMLQTLKLNKCVHLEVLPRGINKLVSLRHLELLGSDSLRCMPCGLGQLSCLQTLTTFAVSEDNGARISELGLLNNLSGSLSIRGLEHVRDDTSEVKSAKLLLEKQYLQKLNLYWRGSDADMKREELEEVTCKDEMVLNALQPHPSIKGLEINGFCGRSLPAWISDLSSLKTLGIWNCQILEWLLESMVNLSSLQRLHIWQCEALSSLPESMGNLSSLQELHIWQCEALSSLPESMGNLSSLQRLDIRQGEALSSLPESMGNLSSLQELDIRQCEALSSLPESMGNLSSLQELYIGQCEALSSLPESMGNLSSLQWLHIRQGEALSSLPESMGNLSSLQGLHIQNCGTLSSLPDGMQNLKELKVLDISNCPRLAKRCKWEEGEDWPKVAHIPHILIMKV